MLVEELPFNDRVALGATHIVRITADDLTETVADTDQTLTIAMLRGSLFALVAQKLVTAFSDASDADLNDTQITWGDGGDADRYLAATQINANGTDIGYAPGLSAGFAYNVPGTVDILVESMTGKSLSDIDTGELIAFIKKVDLPRYGPHV